MTAESGKLGTSDYFSLAFGTIIGIGWITILGAWLADAGSMGSTLAFVIGMLFFLPIGLCYAEMVGIYPLTGGPIVYAINEIGLRTSFFTGWVLFLSFLFTVIFEVISIAWVMDAIWPASKGVSLYSILGADIYAGHLVFGIGANLWLCWSNLQGPGSTGRLQKIIIAILVMIVLVLSVSALSNGSTANLEPYFVFDASGSLMPGLISVLVTVPFMLAGFETIAQGAGERDQSMPPERVAQVILLAIVGATIFYVVIIWSASMVAPREQLLASDLVAARAFEVGLGSTLLMKVVLIGGLMGLLSTLNACIFACLRILLTMSRAGMIWSGFAKTNDAGISVYAVVLVVIAGTLGALLGRNAIMPLVNSSSATIGIVFFIVAICVIASRRNNPALVRPYRMKFGLLLPVIGMIALAATVYLALAESYSEDVTFPLEWMLLVVLMALGLILWWLGSRSREDLSLEEIKRRVS